MNHIMLDIETLDTSPTSVVVSFGAVVFDPYSISELGEMFYAEFTDDLHAQQERGRTLSVDTVKWWMQQDAAAKALFGPTLGTPSIDNDRMTTVKGLEQFVDFCGRNGGAGKVKLWGNGIDFDNVVLASLYQSFGVRRPWSFRHNRCYRTMINQVPYNTIPLERTGVHHNGLDDAITQAKHLQKIFAHLNIGDPT